MPGNRQTLALERVYADRLADLARQVVAILGDRYNAVDRDALGPGFRRLLPAAAATITLAQAQAQALSGGFVRQLVRLETGRPWEPAPPDQAIPGTTAGGRAVVSALAGVPPTVLGAIKAGHPVEVAMARGLRVLARIAATEPQDAARREVRHQLAAGRRTFAGWQWVSRGTCAACLAMQTGDTNPGDVFLNAHPGCTCVMSPAVAGVPERVPRPTGADEFEAMTPEAQDALFTPAVAAGLRLGVITLASLVRVDPNPGWRPTITVAAAPPEVDGLAAEEDEDDEDADEQAQADKRKGARA